MRILLSILIFAAALFAARASESVVPDCDILTVCAGGTGQAILGQPIVTPELLAAWLKKAVKLDNSQIKQLDGALKTCAPRALRKLQFSSQQAKIFQKMKSNKDFNVSDKLADESEELQAQEDKELGKSCSPLAEFRTEVNKFLTAEQQTAWKKAQVVNYIDVAPEVAVMSGGRKVQGKLLNMANFDPITFMCDGTLLVNGKVDTVKYECISLKFVTPCANPLR